MSYSLERTLLALSIPPTTSLLPLGYLYSCSLVLKCTPLLSVSTNFSYVTIVDCVNDSLVFLTINALIPGYFWAQRWILCNQVRLLPVPAGPSNRTSGLRSYIACLLSPNGSNAP